MQTNLTTGFTKLINKLKCDILVILWTMPIILNSFADVTFNREVEGIWKLEAGPLSLEQIAAKRVRAALGVHQKFIFKFQTHS